MKPEKLANIHAAAFPKGRSWSTAEFRKMQDNPYTYLTTEEHGFAIWRSIANEAELLTIAVHPSQQNRGFGNSLMQNWMAQAAETANTAFLEVATNNASACKLYEKFGFLTVSLRKNYYPTEKGFIHAKLMRARLPFTHIQRAQ